MEILSYLPGSGDRWLDISFACRQLRSEFLPIMMDSLPGLNPMSLEKFMRWTEYGFPDLLTLAKKISIDLPRGGYLPMEVLGRAVRAEFGPRSKWETRCREIFDNNSDRKTGNFHMCTDKRLVSALQSSLSSISNTKCLHIRFNAKPRKYKCEQHFLELVSSALPNVTDLCAEIPHRQSLGFILQFSKLKSLSFTGRSSSSPAEMVAIFQSLKCLKHLSITDSNYRTKSKVDSLSFTPDILAQIQPLTSFTIFNPGFNKSKTHFTFNSEVVRALRPHSASLRSLSIRNSESNLLSKELLQELLNFIKSSQIKNLSLDVFILMGLAPITGKDFLPKAEDGKEPDIYLEHKEFQRLNHTRSKVWMGPQASVQRSRSEQRQRLRT